MEKLEKDFLLLLKYVATGECDQENDWENTNWAEFFGLCRMNGLTALAYDFIKDKPNIDDDFKKFWNGYKLKVFLRQKSAFNTIKALLNDFDENGIGYAVIKGNVIAALYREPFCRSSADADIYVDEKDKDEAFKYLEKHGYRLDEGMTESTFVYAFVNDKIEHEIELHVTLFSIYSGKLIEQLKKMNLTGADKRVKVKLDNYEFSTLGHTEHLIFQVFHFTKHFIEGSMSSRYMIDFSLFVNAYYDEIDWDKFWKAMKSLNYDTFIKNYFYLCQKYTGMSEKVSSTKLSEEAEEKILLDLIYVGNSNNNQMSVNMFNTMKGYVEQDEDNSKFKHFINALFPSAERINSRYSYALRHKFLLPIAWIHRMFFKLLEIITNKGDVPTLSDMSEAIDERVDLINAIGLSKKKGK